MSRRTSIVEALAEKLKVIDGTAPYKSNLYDQAHAKLVFWDQTSTFPSVYAVAGAEQREYHPGNFAWGFLNVALKVYCKGETAQKELEDLLEDIERVINDNRVLKYGPSVPAYTPPDPVPPTVYEGETTEILITSIITDEGLLDPYAVGEVNLQVRYQIMI